MRRHTMAVLVSLVVLAAPATASAQSDGTKGGDPWAGDDSTWWTDGGDGAYRDDGGYWDDNGNNEPGRR